MTSASSPARSRRPVRLLALLLAFAGVLFVGVTASGQAEAAPLRKSSLTVPVHGETAAGKPVIGTYTIKKFKTRHGHLVAKATFKGTVGKAEHKVKKAVTLRVKQAAPKAAAKTAERHVMAAPASCQILDLVLRPLDLNLLGLKVHLDRVHLNLTAQPGSGNLLGNLLGAVTGLLDQPPTAALNRIIARLLNAIIGILG